MHFGLKLLTLLLAVATASTGAEVVSSGDWIETIDASNLVGGAGTSLASAIESAPAASNIDIVNTAGASWRLLVRCADPGWPEQIILRLRRTTDGSGSGVIDGGLVYSEIGVLDTEICSGTGDRIGIGVQFRATGMSLNVPTGIHQASLIFTVSTD